MFEMHQMGRGGNDNIGLFAGPERIHQPRRIGIAAKIVPRTANDQRRRGDAATRPGG
jgi:hypothetical protein